MFDKFLDFLAKHKASTHAIAVAGGLLWMYYTNSPSAQLTVHQWATHLPKWLLDLGTLAAGFYAWYRNSQKPNQ